MVHPLLSLIFIIGVVSNAWTCPDTCRCKMYQRENIQKDTSYYMSVSCDSFVGNISQTMDNTTKTIELENLNEEELLDVLDDLSRNESELPYLTNLIIIRSGIRNLNSSIDAFELFHSLTLIHNELDHVPRLLLNLSKLQNVDLSHNEIESIEQEPFRTLRMLELLNLSANAITEINSRSFSGLNVLKCLDLSRNNLSKLGDEVLVPLSSLQHLNLSNNRLEILNEQCFSSLIMLQQLDVSWNRLARVAPGSLQLPSLARLLLAGNPQLGRSREVNVLVGTGRKLQTVDASRTGLKQVPAALTHSIRTLRLAGNSIRSVNCGDLDSYPLLQLLDFSSNDIEVVEEDSLGRLEYLSILYFSDNKISAIPRSLPEKLKVLHLEYNSIERVSDKGLQGLAALEVLLLNDNKITVVEEAAFSQLVSLVTLDLSRNPVGILQPGCLSGPSALQVLRLASIGIISPAKEVSFPLSTTEYLLTLDLSDSPGLARQFLADTAALAASRELQELDLSHTELEIIRSDMLHYLPQLRVLHIANNKLNCSKLQWLASWLRRQAEREYADVICASPADLWGTPLVDLQDTDISAASTPEVIEDKKLFPGFKGQYTTESTNFSTAAKTVGSATNIKYSRNKNRNDGKNNLMENNKLYSKLVGNANKENEVYVTNSKVNSTKSWLNRTLHTTKIINLDEEKDLPNNNKGMNIHIVKNIFSSIKIPTEPTARSDKLELRATYDVNDASRSQDNKSDGAEKIFMTHKKSLFINNSSDKYKLGVPEPAIDLVELPWNSSTGETSMYINNKQEDGLLLHPSMLILGTALMVTVAVLAMLAARITKRRRSSNSSIHEDIEVSSLPSVTELW